MKTTDEFGFEALYAEDGDEVRFLVGELGAYIAVSAREGGVSVRGMDARKATEINGRLGYHTSVLIIEPEASNVVEVRLLVRELEAPPHD